MGIFLILKQNPSFRGVSFFISLSTRGYHQGSRRKEFDPEQGGKR